MTKDDRLKGAAVAFVVVFALFAIDALNQTQGHYAIGVLSWVGVAALFHCIAFDAALNHSRIGLWLVWFAVLAASSSAFYFLTDLVVATSAMLGLAMYTWLLLWIVKKQSSEESSAV